LSRKESKQSKQITLAQELAAL